MNMEEIEEEFNRLQASGYFTPNTTVGPDPTSGLPVCYSLMKLADIWQGADEK